mmetsp:Transcript_7564/g.31309  ORF Transcript_7564/g.31309 Transcript_7564/m.31309 type:complete len:308 (+) Transcript_7564:159-1082(+)
MGSESPRQRRPGHRSRHHLQGCACSPLAVRRMYTAAARPPLTSVQPVSEQRRVSLSTVSDTQGETCNTDRRGAARLPKGVRSSHTEAVKTPRVGVVRSMPSRIWSSRRGFCRREDVGVEVAVADARAVVEFGVVARGGPARGHRAGPRVEDDVVAAPSRRVAAAAARGARRARGAVEGVRVEDDDVAGAHVPLEQRRVARRDERVDVGDRVEPPRGVCVVAAVSAVDVAVRVVGAREVCDGVAELGGVRALDVSDADVRRHVVQREPDRADLRARELPVARVVVPRRRRDGAGLFDEELVVEDVRGV